jgi:hypothetical protein
MTSMAQAYDVAALAVRQRLAEQHPERLEALNGLVKRDIAVFRGQPDAINFATIQSAATSTELVAQLCIEAASRPAKSVESTERGGLLSMFKKAVS